MALEIVELISNVGFPMAISLYFIFKVERVVKNNTVALVQMKEVVKRCSK